MADIREDVMVDEEIALTDIDSGMIISYDELGSKPSINGVEVEGAKTSADYGLAAAGASYTKAEEDTLLSAKADKADTYTKAETDAKPTAETAIRRQRKMPCWAQRPMPHRYTRSRRLTVPSLRHSLT